MTPTPPPAANALPLFIVRHLPAWVVNGITVTLGLALVQASISLMAGQAAAQVAIGTAVCASLADVVATANRVGRRVLVALLASTLAAVIFLAVRPFGPALVPAVALIVFAAMLTLSWGPKAGTVAFATIVSLVFAMSVPRSVGLSWDRFAWGMVGSAGYWLWAVVTAKLLQPTWRTYALAATAENMARLMAAVARQIALPGDAIWRSEIVDEEAALADRLQTARDLVFNDDKGKNAGRDTAILLHLIDLRDLAMASDVIGPLFTGGPVTRHNSELAGRIIEKISGALTVVARHLRTGGASAVDARIDESIERLLAELEEFTGTDPCTTTIAVTGLLQAELDLLRSIQRLLASGPPGALPCQRDDLRRYVSPDEWRLAAVMANLRPDAPVFRHALRTAVTAGAAYALARATSFTPHPQWVVLTVAAVMQGNLAQTLVRRNARVLGTLAGCVVVVLLTGSASIPLLSACFLVAAGVGHAFFGVRYSVTAGAAAVMAVLQAHLVGSPGGFDALERFGDTLAGALLGWAATYVLPTWERKNLPDAMRQAMDALRAYADEATKLQADPAGLPRFARQRAYDALRALNATRSRSLVEPADVRVPIAQLTSWLSAAYGVMSHLSNLRLTLTLYARDHETPELAGAMAEVSRALGAVLRADPAALQQQPAIGPESSRALDVVPNLASRVQRTLHDALRVSSQSARIEGLLGA